MGFEDVFIVGYARTPFGSFQGALSTKDACELGAIALKAALKNAKVDTQLVEELVMGCALTAGLGQAPATRVAALAGLPTTTSSYVISKVCASGTKAIQLASNSVKTGMSHIVAAGGMESMSRAPFLLPTNCRNGLKFGDHNLIDSLLHDGLTDSMTGVSMGKCGEDCAHENGITREAADDFAIRSYQRTIENTSFLAEEIIPVDSFMGPDERLSSIGTVTAANASPMSDGAAVVIIASGSAVKLHGLEPLARIVGWADASTDPLHFTIAPYHSIMNALRMINYKLEDVDYFEINEAFASVAIANSKLLGIDVEKINVCGGAIAIGHPLGASGARIVGTLTRILEAKKGNIGVAAICNGGGGASSIVIERVGRSTHNS